MAHVKITTDGLYALNNDMNTAETTIYVGDIGGATVAIGFNDPDGNWTPFPNSTLTSHTPLSISHGHDIMLIALAADVSGEINIETRKEGLGGLEGILNVIADNTQSPIKVDAPPTDQGHWRQVDSVTGTGFWRLDPIQTDAPGDGKPYARLAGTDSWVETITRVEYDTAQNNQDDRLDIIESEYVHWEGQWVTQEYTTNSLVRDGEWTMIANKDTSDRPAPQPVGGPETDIPSISFLTGSDESVVYTGHLYTFKQSGYVRKLEVYVPELSSTTNYRLRLIKDPFGTPVSSELLEPVLIENGWATVVIGNTLYTEGEQVLVYVDALNSGEVTTWQYPWTYAGSGNNVDPTLSGTWTKNGSNTQLRINKIDGDGTDHTQELNVIPGTTFNITQLNDPDKWIEFITIGAAVDMGTWYEFNVFEQGQGVNIPDQGVGTQIRAQQPIALPTQYSESVDYWVGNEPDFAVVQGFKQFDGASVPLVENNAYGIRVEFQRYVASDDWEVVALNSDGTGGSGTGGTIPRTIALSNGNLQETPTDAVGGYVTANDDQFFSPDGYTGLWTIDPNTATFTYRGSTPQGFKIMGSGAISSESTGNTDHIFVRLLESSGVMTGSTKRYSAGRSDGNITSDVGFNSIGFGLFNPGDTVQFQIAKDFAGNLTVSDMIIDFEPL